MFSKILSKSKKIIAGPQSSIFSAATIIMVMVFASKLLGFIRQRVLFTYFAPEQTDLYLAAFEIPDLLFEVFVFGVLSAAFIPVFSKYLSKDKKKEAWHVAASSLNLLLLVFSALALFAFIFTGPIYGLLTGGFVKSQIGASGGFSSTQIDTVVTLSRILLFAQLFFVVSSFLTAVLESFKRFLVPALAPLLYNIGIIFGIIVLSPYFGLLGAVIGALIGAILHLSIQIPLAWHLGFRPRAVLDLANEGVRKIVSLSIPRVIELAFMQVRRVAWLFLASAVSGGFTYLKSAELILTVPIGVFGLSLAKAAFPTLSEFAGKRDMDAFKNTFLTTLNQIMFLVVPFAVFLMILRVPVVRLIFGATQFDWNATVQTGFVLSAFAIGIFAYAGTLLVSRSFYALQDTKTPVAVSILAALINVFLGFLLILGVNLETWGIALSYSVAGITQFTILMAILVKKIRFNIYDFLVPFVKIVASAATSGFVMYTLLKIFDRSVWVKRLSFLSAIESVQEIPFQNFVLDTRYTGNLIILTFLVSLIGLAVYIIVAMLLRTREVYTTLGFVQRIAFRRKKSPISDEETEIVSPTHTDTTT